MVFQSLSICPALSLHCHYTTYHCCNLAVQEDGVLHVVSPSLSTKVPKAPAGTPATFHSPTKSLLLREVTAASSLHGGDGLGATPSREISMSPGHKFWVPSATSPGPAASPTDLGKRVYDDDGGGGGDDDGDDCDMWLWQLLSLPAPTASPTDLGKRLKIKIIMMMVVMIMMIMMLMVMWWWPFWVPSATSPGPAASPTDLGKRVFVVVFLTFFLWWWWWWSWSWWCWWWCDDDPSGCHQPPLPAPLPRPLIWVSEFLLLFF